VEKESEGTILAKAYKRPPILKRAPEKISCPGKKKRQNGKKTAWADTFNGHVIDSTLEHRWG